MFSGLLMFLIDIFRQRRMLIELSKNDFKQQYLGSAIGIIWAFVQPLVMILIYLFAFTFGFRVGTVDNVPFVCWLVAGIIPYFFFLDAWNKGTNCILEYSYLVKKIVFPVRLIVIIKLLSSCYIHLAFLIFVIVLLAIYGYYPDLYYLQLIYYLFALCILLLGLGWLCSSMQVFFRDVSQVIGVISQVLLWCTPIMYSSSIISKEVLNFLKLNPFYYIVQGYRDAFISKQWPWQHPIQTLYFWIITLFIFALGILVFRQLRPHFANIL